MFNKERFLTGWSALNDQVDEKNLRAEAWGEQEKAKYLRKSGGTQQEIADAIGVDQSWVALQLRFGAFLHFMTTVIKLKKASNLTEGRFRGYWKKTSGRKDETRFKKVIAMMEDDFVLVAPNSELSRQILARFGDWKWHKRQEVLDAIEAGEIKCEHHDPASVITNALGRLKEGAYGCRFESKGPTMNSNVVRSFRVKKLKSVAKKKVSQDWLCDTLLPLIRRAISNVKDKHQTAEFSRELTEGNLMQIEGVILWVMGEGPMPKIEEFAKDFQQEIKS